MQKYIYSPELRRSMKARRIAKIKEGAIWFGFLSFEFVFFFLCLIPDFRENYGLFFMLPFFVANIVFIWADWYE